MCVKHITLRERQENDEPIKNRSTQKRAVQPSGEAQSRREQAEVPRSTRGGMLEKFLINPGVLSDDQVMEILKSAFRRDEVTALIHSFLRENMTAENEEDGMQSS